MNEEPLHADHGRRLREAMAAVGADRKLVAAATDRSTRMVSNWTSGRHLPDPEARMALRKLFPGYDDLGDPVEVAVRRSTLTEDRQYDVIGYYKRRLREQEEEREVRGA